ncbi:alpha/beta hydrolase [Pseudonocardia sp. NPDC049154]|uniref:alpha/beta fold hydrolase n=1 Tax=Pseudonocardia sp. NPDC049154 TaxID=3155501 RepID=UPI0033DFE606
MIALESTRPGTGGFPLEHHHVRGAADNMLHVVAAGKGPLVVLVHVFPESWRSWRYVLPALAQAGYRAVAVDVRGYGGSDKPWPVSAYTIRELAADILAVVDEFGGSPAVLVGHDWGAPQVYGAALIFPAEVRAVVGLSAPASRPPTSDPFERFASVYGDAFFYMSYFAEPGRAEAELEADPARFLRRFVHAMAGDRAPGTPNPLRGPADRTTLLDDLPDPIRVPTWFDDTELHWLASRFQEGGLRGPLNRYRAQSLDVDQLRPYADRTVEVPSLFIGGAADPARYMVGDQDRFADPLPIMTDVRGVHLVDGAGHWIQQEAPRAVLAHLLPFLQELSP